jgi:hypothetical protein
VSARVPENPGPDHTPLREALGIWLDDVRWRVATPFYLLERSYRRYQYRRRALATPLALVEAQCRAWAYPVGTLVSLRDEAPTELCRTTTRSVATPRRTADGWRAEIELDGQPRPVALCNILAVGVPIPGVRVARLNDVACAMRAAEQAERLGQRRHAHEEPGYDSLVDEYWALHDEFYESLLGAWFPAEETASWVRNSGTCRSSACQAGVGPTFAFGADRRPIAVWPECCPQCGGEVAW